MYIYIYYMYIYIYILYVYVYIYILYVYIYIYIYLHIVLLGRFGVCCSFECVRHASMPTGTFWFKVFPKMADKGESLKRESLRSKTCCWHNLFPNPPKPTASPTQWWQPIPTCSRAVDDEEHQVHAWEHRFTPGCMRESHGCCRHPRWVPTNWG